jgi:hypothetical protein
MESCTNLGLPLEHIFFFGDCNYPNRLAFGRVISNVAAPIGPEGHQLLHMEIGAWGSSENYQASHSDLVLNVSRSSRLPRRKLTSRLSCRRSKCPPLSDPAF